MARKAKQPATAREVREWAVERGFEVGVRGRLPESVQTAFMKATKREVVTAAQG